MKLTREQELVLGAIAGLSSGDAGVPVTISAVHHTFYDMDVSDLVLHLGILLEGGLIRNARPAMEKNQQYVCYHAGRNAVLPAGY